MIDLDERIEDWVADGLLDDATAEALPRTEPVNRGTQLAEGLGYLGLGAVLAAIAAAIFQGAFDSTNKDTIIGLLVVALTTGLAVGQALERSAVPAVRRFGRILWLSAPGFLALLVMASIDRWRSVDSEHVFWAFVAATGLAVVLWWVRRRSAQIVALVASTTAAILAALDAFVSRPSGIEDSLALVVLGVVVVATGLTGWFRPRRAALASGYAVLLLAGWFAAFSGDRDPLALTLVLATLYLFIAAGFLTRRLLPLGLGVLAGVIYLPRVSEEFGQSSTDGALMLALAGSGIVLAAVALAVSGPSATPGRRRPLSSSPLLLLGALVVPAVGAVAVGYAARAEVPAFPVYTELAERPAGSIAALTPLEDGMQCLVVVDFATDDRSELCRESRLSAVAWTPAGEVLVSETVGGPEYLVFDPGVGVVGRIARSEVVDRIEARDMLDARRSPFAENDYDGGISVGLRVLNDTDEVRFEATGPARYRVGKAALSPDGEWVTTEDSEGRVLAVNVDGTPGPRVLLEGIDPLGDVAWFVPGEPYGTAVLEGQ